MAEPQPTPFARLERLAGIWRSRVDGPARKAAVAVGVGAVFGLAHLARVGTPAARIACGASMVALLVAFVARFMATRRGWRDPKWIVRRAIVTYDPELGHRALRAMRLAARMQDDPQAGSGELARAHLERTLARARTEEVETHASARGRLFQRAALAAGVLGLLAVVVGPFRVVEGLDVLFARRGVAPVAFEWLEEAGLVGHPPDYLHERDVIPENLSHTEFPYGSLLTIRGTPLHPGRKLVLVDGNTEVPFVDDGSGGVVARWSLAASTKLRVAARFGRVLIEEPHAIEVVSIPDEAPVVRLSGAPKTVKLLDAPDIEVSYEATDDHGLREVHLVLRSAGREERRVLARLDGETRHERGGHRLWASDRFFKRAYAPVEITVEARDNDPLRGPKWGKSAAIVVVPPTVGEPEAMRYQALLRARNAFVDLTAFRIENDLDGNKLDGGQLRAHALREKEEQARAVSELEASLDGTFGGLKIQKRLRTLAEGQIRKLTEAADKELKTTSKTTHAGGRKLTEDFTLTLDGVLRRLDVTDSATIAKRLAEVADDAAEGALEASRPAEREHGKDRIEIGTGILDGGGGELRRLGTLGRDLGEIVANDLMRARRAFGTEDYFHGELALRDLAARLRHPSPSFGGGLRGGVEAGGGQSPEGDPSDGGQQIAREQEQIDELARDHGAEVSGVEQSMNSAESNEEQAKMREEAKQHAQAVRDAVRSLPRSGGEPNSAEGAAAAAREHAEAMADALERGSAADAVKS
ncbi:MAG TPA: DUF4175 domain-containing protein, partial [Polyangiaceae bacterium]|nr:DUF4175 domain-containing protein [Polyangiaceae bacterium]